MISSVVLRLFECVRDGAINVCPRPEVDTFTGRVALDVSVVGEKKVPKDGEFPGVSGDEVLLVLLKLEVHPWPLDGAHVPGLRRPAPARAFLEVAIRRTRRRVVVRSALPPRTAGQEAHVGRRPGRQTVQGEGGWRSSS